VKGDLVASRHGSTGCLHLTGFSIRRTGRERAGSDTLPAPVSTAWNCEVALLVFRVVAAGNHHPEWSCTGR
jgi:hypothetical protein